MTKYKLTGYLYLPVFEVIAGQTKRGEKRLVYLRRWLEGDETVRADLVIKRRGSERGRRNEKNVWVGCRCYFSWEFCLVAPMRDCLSYEDVNSTLYAASATKRAE